MRFFPETKIQHKRGFTMIELLVVISIVGLLASVVLVAFNLSRAKARDAKRKSDALQIRKALEFYFQNNSVYPNGGAVGASNTPVSAVALRSFLVPAVADQVPTDPSCPGGDITCNYEYVWGNSGRDYGLLVPFSNEPFSQLVDCKFISPNGDSNWFGYTQGGGKGKGKGQGGQFVSVPDCGFQ